MVEVEIEGIGSVVVNRPNNIVKELPDGRKRKLRGIRVVGLTRVILFLYREKKKVL